MGRTLKKIETRLKQRREAFDSLRATRGLIRPGSMNPKKSHPQGKKR